MRQTLSIYVVASVTDEVVTPGNVVTFHKDRIQKFWNWCIAYLLVKSACYEWAYTKDVESQPRYTVQLHVFTGCLGPVAEKIWFSQSCILFENGCCWNSGSVFVNPPTVFKRVAPRGPIRMWYFILLAPTYSNDHYLPNIINCAIVHSW